MKIHRFYSYFSGKTSLYACAVVIWAVIYILCGQTVRISGAEAAPPAPDTAAQAALIQPGRPVPPVQPPVIPAKPASFEKSVFLGNSSIASLYVYGLVSDADFLYRVGLTVNSVFTKPTVTGTVPVMDELDGRQYGQIFLMFGQNELGWVYTDIFIDRYAAVIDAVKERQPGARIYVMSIPPVSEKVSLKNANGVNQPKIDEYNARLAELARLKNAGYLNASPALADKSGFLPEDASTDGVHLNKTYSEIWVQAIKDQLKGS
ncbi:MAG: GDSL-type esterase/lipase family protein [Peptococcaceae bacterium]|nr:GDSL-type esterase/lipase family protein [Peptococcaceae bacterium]